MPDKKLTDCEIVKVLDICSKSNNGCSHSKYACEDCYLNGQPMCSSVLLQDALDLINRLQAENSNLTSDLTSLKNDLTSSKEEIERLRKSNEMFTDIGKLYSEIKAEAYKEFAERLKHKAINIGVNDSIVSTYAIDETLKELVGE